MINPISFKGKIPISKFNYYNSVKNRYEEASFSEIDCKDKSDIAFVEYSPHLYFLQGKF